MGTLNISRSLYLDGLMPGGHNCALDGTLSSPPSMPFAFTAGDTFPISVFFREKSPTMGASTALTPASGSTCVMAGKIAASAGVLLFLSELTVSSDHYVGSLDLNTDAIVAIMTAVNHGEYVDIFVDFEVRNAAETEIQTYRTPCRIYKQVYAGETTPSSVVVPPPVLVSPDGSRWQMSVTDDGQTQFTKVSA